MGSCKKDRGNDIPVVTGEGREVEITVSAAISTRGEIAAESTINTLDLLVFERQVAGSVVGDAADAEFLYSRYAWLQSGNVYRAILQLGEHVDIYFAVNARDLLNDLIAADEITEGMTWSAVCQKLVMTDPDQISPTVGGLPMWGNLFDKTIEDKPLNIMGEVKLLRSVASTDVSVTATNFTLSKGYLVFAADKGLLAFSASNMSAPDVNGDFYSTGPEVPSGMAADQEWAYTVGSGVNTIDNFFYMYENDAPDDDRRYTKIVLEGKWSSSQKADPTFYPLAFRKQSDNTKLQATRNNKYIIVVTGVNGDGYDTLEEAKDADDVNMEYDVIPWNMNEDDDIYIDGSKYLSLGGKSATLYRNQGNTYFISVTTNYDADDIMMKFAEADAGENPLLENDRFKIELKEVGGQLGFLFTAKQNYSDGAADDKEATMIVTVGRIKFTISMEQTDGHPNDWIDGGNQGEDL